MKASTNPKRRLGPLDRRRVSYRCKNCRSSHRKCDQERPCSACRIRNLDCEPGTEPSPHDTDNLILWSAPEPSSSAESAQLAPPTVQTIPELGDVSDYIDALFEFTGEAAGLPLPIQALAAPYMLPLINNHESVLLAATTIGALLRKLQRDPNDRNAMDVLTSISEHTFSRASEHLQSAVKSTSTPDLPTITCAFLLCFYLLMIDESTTRLINWTAQIFRPLLQRWGQEASPDPVVKPFLRLFWIFDSVFAIELDQDTFLADEAWLERLDVPPKLSPPTLDGLNDFLLHLFARFVRLNASIVYRAYQEHNGSSYPRLSSDDSTLTAKDVKISHEEYTGFTTEGLSLFADSEMLHGVLEAYEAQLRESHSKLSPGSDTPPTLSFLVSYTNLILISIARLLETMMPQRPNDSHKDVEGETDAEKGTTVERPRIDPIPSTGFLPADHDSVEAGLLQNIDEAAVTLKAFQMILERFEQQSPAESILHIPAITALALEAQCKELRRRVADLFTAIHQAGFIVAHVALGDMMMAWNTTATGCGNLCICNSSVDDMDEG